tara:strand:- start:269 stop:652 length:384 start_codon:yes stop_codon:yes gene_type:complete
MNKSGKIVAYQPNGEAEIKGTQYNRFLVTFADGQEWKFLAKGEFKKKIGDTVEYIIKNEQYKNAAFVAEPRPNFNNNGSRPASTNDSILLQVCYKENMQAFAKENKDSVMSETEKDFIALKQILNKL